MEYGNNYLALIKALRSNREREGGRPVSKKEAGGLGSRIERSPLTIEKEEFDPMAYMRDIDSFIDDDLTESDLAPAESLRPKARPGSEEPLGLDDGVSLRPQSRSDIMNSETGLRLMEDLKEEFDLTDVQAAAIVGNLAQETGDFEFMQEIKPAIEGSKGGWGFAQWTGPRRKMFEDWIAENGLDAKSYEANKGYLFKELTEFDKEIENMGINTLKKIKETDDLEEATRIFSEDFLRPGKPNLGKRIARASGYLEF
jgi:hypothetical protein